MTVSRVEIPRPHRNKLRQVLVQRPQSPGDPGSKGRYTFIKHVPTGNKLNLSAVIIVRRPHRPNERDVVSTTANVRKPVADLDAAFSVLPEPNLQRVQLVALLAVGIVHDDNAHLLQLFGILDALERRVIDRLSGVLCQLGLRIEALHMADAAAHKEQDYVLCLWLNVRQEGMRIAGCRVALQHRIQCQSSESHARTKQLTSSRLTITDRQFCNTHCLPLTRRSRNQSSRHIPCTNRQKFSAG